MTSVTLHIPDETVEAIATRAAKILMAKLASVPDPGGPLWMSVETAAQYLDCSPERLRKLVARRQVAFHQEAPGCRVFFRRSDLDAFLTAHRHEQRTKGEAIP